ncbi:type II secretion system F family protein [Dactylosporangium maewongense]|uniref:type II secretion system F family protein n=1 Tax=Dactylosporangium maewongense TaxID=634393 RepID=UPI0031DCE9AA
MSTALLLAGMVVIVVAAVGTHQPARRPSATVGRLKAVLGFGLTPRERNSRQLLIGLAIGATVAVWLYTGWPVGGLTAGAAVWLTPLLYSVGAREREMIEALEGLEIWTRRLKNLVHTGHGLISGIINSARTAPEPIAAQVAELAADLQAGTDPERALERFADRLDDFRADEVITSLMLHVSDRGQRLSDVLESIATAAADEVAMRRDIAADRAEPRFVARFMTTLTFPRPGRAVPQCRLREAVRDARRAARAGRQHAGPRRAARLGAGADPADSTRSFPGPGRATSQSGTSVQANSVSSAGTDGRTMNIRVLHALLAGALVGLGILVIVRATRPAAPALGPALRQLRAPSADDRGPTIHAPGPLGVLVNRLRIPTAELALIGYSPERYLTEKLVYPFIGLLFPPMLSLILALSGVHLGFVIPAAVGLLFAVVFFVLVDVSVRQKAAEAREEFSRHVAVYLDLVALELAASRGPSEALEAAAAHGGWVCERIRESLRVSRLRLEPPWEGLKDVAAQIGVPDLGEVGDIMTLAGDEGAQVYDTLRSRAKSLNAALLAKDKARAKTATTVLYMPTSLMVLVLFVAGAYPFLYRLVTT